MSSKVTDEQDVKRRCFVISPIGEEGGAARVRSDNVLDFIISPALERCQYEVPPVRADQLPSPGRITRQIIDQLLKVDLVVADLTDHNPNVFYELAIRHASRKPVVQIIHIKDKLPFDVANQRTVFYDHENLRAANRAVEDLVRQIRAVEEDPGSVDTPLTEAILIDHLAQSGDPVARSNADIMAALQEIRAQLAQLSQRVDVRGENISVECLLRNAQRRQLILEALSGQSRSAAHGRGDSAESPESKEEKS